MKYTKLTLAIAVLFAMASCGKKGCTDPMSLAYNSEATKDNGSCTYPANEKRSLVFKFTATWCSYCGEWGAEYVDNIYNDFSSSAEVISIHRNDGFSVDVGDFLYSQLNPQGVPAFFGNLLFLFEKIRFLDADHFFSLKTSFGNPRVKLDDLLFSKGIDRRIVSKSK